MDFFDDEYDIEYDIATDQLHQDIMNSLKELHWFHATLFKYVMIDGISIRQLAKDTDISFNVIRASIFNTKEFLKNKYINEYQKK